jgi:predicted nucleotidyltransferase
MSLLSEILSSKVRAEIFRILFGINIVEVHMREIQRRSGFSIGTIQTELKKLFGLDLVKRRQDGNRIYFSANTIHPLYRDVRSMVLKTNGLAEILRQVLTQASEIQVAFVFGSIARNEEKADSDVDLLIIGDTGLREATKLLSGVSERIGREINPYVMKIEEFLKRKKAHEHFVTRVLAESKLYVIGNDNDLAAMG